MLKIQRAELFVVAWSDTFSTSAGPVSMAYYLGDAEGHFITPEPYYIKVEGDEVLVFNWISQKDAEVHRNNATWVDTKRHVITFIPEGCLIFNLFLPGPTIRFSFYQPVCHLSPLYL